MGFARRRIDVSFQLGEGSFGDSGADTLTVSGLRIEANIAKAGGVGMSEAHVQIFGLTLDQLKQFTILGKPLPSARRNAITLSAGDDDSGMSVVFSGVITEAWPSMEGAPETSLVVHAYASVIDAMRPVPPASYRGPIDVATIMSSLAEQMGYAFVNNGVSVILPDSYYPGTARDQAYAAAADAGINIVIDEGQPQVAPSDAPPPVETGTLATGLTLTIWPKNGTRGGSVPLISAETGMVGYPTCSPSGIIVKTLYNPNIVFGAQVQVQSTIDIANANWYAFNVRHDLMSEGFDGPWFTTVEGSVLGEEVPLGGQ